MIVLNKGKMSGLLIVIIKINYIRHKNSKILSCLHNE